MKKNPIKLFILFACLIGLGLIGFIIWIEESHPRTVVFREAARPAGVAPDSPPVSREFVQEEEPAFSRLGIKFIDHLAIAFLSIGVIGLLLEFQHTRKYFHDQLVDLILDRGFLKDLSDEAVRELQVKTLNRVFGIENIDKASDFFDFYMSKIQGYLISPYREGTVGTVNIVEEGNFFRVEETISYTCRKVGKGIQKEVEWTTETDELEKDGIKEFQITLTFPNHIGGQSGQEPPRIYKKDAPELKRYDKGQGYSLPLNDYAAVDGLHVKCCVTYMVPIDRPFSWWMPNLSKGLKVTITFPDKFDIYDDLFVMDAKEEGNPKGTRGQYTFNHETWLMPRDGFAFHLRRRTEATGNGGDAAPDVPNPAPAIESTPTPVIESTPAPPGDKDAPGTTSKS